MAYEYNGSQLEYIEVPLQKPRKIHRRKALLGSRERIHLVFIPDSLEEVSQDSKVEAKSDVLKKLRLPRRHHQLAGVEGASAGTKVVIASKCLVARRRSPLPLPPLPPKPCTATKRLVSHSPLACPSSGYTKLRFTLWPLPSFGACVGGEKRRRRSSVL